DEGRLLAEIEKLLKRTIPRKSLDDFDPDRSRERPQRRETHDAAPKREPRRSAPPAARSAAPLQVAGDGFDFSKPYEPAATPGAGADKSPPPSVRHRNARPTAALLGGLRAPAKPAK